MISYSIKDIYLDSKKNFSCLLFLFFCIKVFSQTTITLKSIDTIKDVSKKTQAYVDFAYKYSFKNNDSALLALNEAIIISDKHTYLLGKTKALEGKGLYYEVAKGDYKLASTYYFEALKLCENNNLNYIKNIYVSLGIMYHTSDNYKEAEKFYKLAYEIALKENDLDLQKRCLSNLAAIYSSQENFEQAIEYFNKSFDINVRRDVDFINYGNLGNLYIRKKEYKNAIPYLFKATKKDSDNRNADSKIRFLLEAKAALKDSSNMKPYLERAINFANKPDEIRETKLMCGALFKYFEAIGNYKDAITYQKRYVNLYEQSVQNHRHDITLELEAKYQSEKTKLALEQKEEERKLYLLLFVIGLLFSGLLGFLFYANKKKNKLLAIQKQRLETTIDEKNLLLKETHHRVKNSFQIVSSLLFLQSENLKDKDAKMVIKEAENRVRSMVLIHQKLYNKDQLVGIDSKEYFTDLIADIFESHQLDNQNLKCNSSVERIVLDIETMTLIGLILNELIVNVLKHAFPSSSSKNFLWVEFYEAKNLLLLKVKDNGKGFDTTINRDSFGITLIKALCKKLKGSITYNPQKGGGTEATLSIAQYNILK